MRQFRYLTFTKPNEKMKDEANEFSAKGIGREVEWKGVGEGNRKFSPR